MPAGQYNPQPTTPATRDFDPATDRKVSSKVSSRLAIAHEVINDVKQINAHAGNQKEGLRATLGNAAYRGPMLRDDVSSSNWKWSSDAAKLLANQYPEAFFMAKAELLGAVSAPGVTNPGAGGTCYDQAHLAYYFLRIKAAGDFISVISSPTIDHAYTHIGNYDTEDHADVAVCDPWPTAATAVPWDEHFCNGSPVTRGLHMIADGGGKTSDGRDVKEAIKASLSLTPQAEAEIQTTLTQPELDEHLRTGQPVRPGQPYYSHWDHRNTVRQGAEIRSLDPESPGGRYMTDEQIRDAAGPATSSGPGGAMRPAAGRQP